MSATTSNTHKNYYGPRKRSKGKKSRMDYKIEKIAKSVYNEKEAKEVELKYYDYPEVNNAFVPNGGSIYRLSDLIPKGTDDQERIGDQISLKSLFIRLDARTNEGGTNYHNIRLIIFRFFGTGTPASSEILKLTTATVIRQLSQLNMDFTQQIQTLHDQTYQMANFASSNLSYAICDKFYLKLRGLAHWNNQTGLNQKGNIYMLVISDSTVQPQILFTSRLRYTDS